MGGMGGGAMNVDKDKMKQALQGHFQQKVMVVDNIDRQVWELVSNVPYVQKPVAIIAAIFNFLFPGFGTMIAACAAQDNVSKTQLVIGLTQFLTAFVLIGWIWSIYWGYLLVMKSMDMQSNNMRGGPMGGMSGGSQGYGSDPNMGYGGGF